MTETVKAWGRDQLIAHRFNHVQVSDRFVEELLPRRERGYPSDMTIDERAQAEQQDRLEREQEHIKLRKELEDMVGDAFARGVEMAVDREANRAYRARSTVLLLVVLAVVAMPIVAILIGLDPDSFGAYIAPITGIAGTVVGFWFSSAKGAAAG